MIRCPHCGKWMDTLTDEGSYIKTRFSFGNYVCTYCKGKVGYHSTDGVVKL